MNESSAELVNNKDDKKSGEQIGPIAKFDAEYYFNEDDDLFEHLDGNHFGQVKMDGSDQMNLVAKNGDNQFRVETNQGNLPSVFF